MRPSSSRCCRLAMAGLVLATAGVPLRAQHVAPRTLPTGPAHAEPRLDAPHGLLLGANMLLGGLTAGTLQWRHGGSFLDGFARGALGGAAVYGGKVLVVRDGTAAPFFGRQLAAVGASTVRNAGAGEPLLSDLSLPFGPLRLHVSARAQRRAWLGVDLLGVASLAGALVLYEARLDWQASLAAAAPVFVVADPEDELPWNGRHVGGLLMLRDDRTSDRPVSAAETLAHERVHLLQYDQLSLLWSDPLERALFGRWGWTRAIQPHVDLGLNGAINAALRSLPATVNPVELEAEHLARSR